jgi:hypothetical protein
MSVQQPSQIGTTVESSHESQTFTTNTATTVAHDDNVNLRGNVDISDARELLEAGNAEAVVNDPDDKTSDQLGRRVTANHTLVSRPPLPHQRRSPVCQFRLPRRLGVPRCTRVST